MSEKWCNVCRKRVPAWDSNCRTCHNELVPLVPLTIDLLREEAIKFGSQPTEWSKDIFWTNDGKKIGTFVERQLRECLGPYLYRFSGRGVDFPDLPVDVKATTADRMRTSAKFDGEEQATNGLGYATLLFVYQKESDRQREMSRLIFTDVRFVPANHVLNLTRVDQWSVNFNHTEKYSLLSHV